MEGFKRIYSCARCVFCVSSSMPERIFRCGEKSIEQNVRQTITANIDRQSVSFSSDITIQYQYLEGLAGYLGESGELCSENVMTLMRKVCEKSDLERIAIIAPDGTAHYRCKEEH